MPILAAIKGIKETDTDKHILIIDSLIDNGILFVEDNLVYTIAAKSGQKAVFFARTGILQKTGKQIKLQSWDELLNYLQ